MTDSRQAPEERPPVGGPQGDVLPVITPPRTGDLTRDQHARKGQAQSPRELNLNQPEKKKEGHR